MTENWKQWEGQVVNGEFQLRQYVGGSDHSAVFLTELGAREPQKAAIKLIAVAPDSAEVQLSRWGLATKLSHPHLMRLFQMGRCQLGGMELLYIVMEYAEEDLSQVLPERSLAPTETRQMLRPVLDALAYVHGKGLVHGHVKPVNIMAVNDQLRISSDGLCPVGEWNGGLGTTSVYDPPETTSGGISPAADIWSLGMTLVEALTQRLPAWERTGQGEPVLPETVPEPFFDIACHCLRRDPRRRWTAADVAARLQPTSPALRPTTAGLQQRVSATWRYMVPVVAVGLALVAMLAGPRLLSRRPEAQPAPPIAFQPPQPRPEQAPSGTEQSTQRSGDAKPSPSVAKQSPINSASSLRPLAAAAIPTDGLGQ